MANADYFHHTVKFLKFNVIFKWTQPTRDLVLFYVHNNEYQNEFKFIVKFGLCGFTVLEGSVFYIRFS